MVGGLPGQPGTTEWDGIDGKPALFPPVPHLHLVADVTGLDAELDGKADVGHTHRLVDVSDVSVSAVEVNCLDGVTGEVQAQLDGKQELSERGQANGYATLDSGGKIPARQLPSTVMEFQGVWDAATNTPILVDGVGDSGDVWRVSSDATVDLGSGPFTVRVGDYVIFNGVRWEPSATTDAVSSVAGRTGDVTLTKTDVGLANVDNTSDATKLAAPGILTHKTISGQDNTLLDVSADSLIDGTTNKVFTAAEKTTLTTLSATVMIVVKHGADANVPRPATAAAVYWQGTVQPANAVDGDLWIGGQ